MEKNVKKYRYIGIYTAVFLALCAGMFLPFLVSGRSLVWITDGESQYFPYLHYMGNAIRDFFERLLQGKLTLEMFDFGIGMGEDVGAVFRSHPLDFLAALVPGRYTELLYQFLILLRIYLAGLAFSAFCFFWGKKEQAVLIGSMIYISCGYVLKLGIAHPTFDSAIIILPLLLLGAERLLRGQSVLLFSIVTALGFLSNYYFMYMCTIVLGVYALWRFFDLYRRQRGKNFLRLVLRMGGAYLLGVGLASAILLPTLLRLGSSARLASGSMEENLWLYEGKRYYQWFLDLISPYRGTGSNTNLNYTVLVLPALVLLFVRRWRERLPLKLAVLAEILLLLIPAGGYLMSGFSAVNNRWVFILSFTLSFVFVAVAEDFSSLNRGQKRGMALVLVLYAGLALWQHFFSKENPYALAALAELLVCTAVVLALQKRKAKAPVWSAALLALTGISAIVSGYMTYSGRFGNTAGEYMERGQALSRYETSPNAAFGRIQEEGFYRTDTNVVTTGTENSSLILGYNGISIYNSIINASQIQYLLDQESIGLNALHRVFSMDGRAVPENLAHVKYYLTSAGEGQHVPYGYAKEPGLSDEGWAIYKNQYPLAFGYTYDRTIDRETYEALSPLEKQQIMMKAAVVESEMSGAEAQTGNVEEKTVREEVQTGNTEENPAEATISEVQQGIVTVPVELPKEGVNLKVVESGYKVKEGGGSISISAEKKAGYERYLHLKGLERDREYSFVDIGTGELQKTVTVRGANATYSLNRSDYLVCLGYDETEGTDEIGISFREKGSYRLAGLEICYVPMEGYARDVEERNEDALEEVVFDTNRVSGKVSLEPEKFMVFSIPYSEGWSAWVDGEKQRLERANVMYLGLSLEPGEHEIRLEYCSPGSRTGICISVTSAVILLLLWLMERRKRRRNTSGK